MGSKLRLHGGALLLVAIAAGSSQGEIRVEGIADKRVYADRVSFRIAPPPAGETYAADLDGRPVGIGVSVEVAEVDYHELRVESNAGESVLLRFIVRASERGNSEWGLPPWVPYPEIPSAAAEFAGARLVIVAPPAYPKGLEIPIIALIEDGAGKRVGVNGLVRPAGSAAGAIRILRGVGHTFLPGAAEPGTIDYRAEIATLSAPREIAIEAETTWTSVSGTIGSSTDWGEGARIRVTGDLAVPAGATLAIGAGSVIALAGEADIFVDGSVRVLGTRERPVVFAPASRAAPWGGFIAKGSSSRIEMQGAIITGSGAVANWFDVNSGSGSSHRREQCAVYFSGGARGIFADCYLIDNRGQIGHGESSTISFTRCLLQKAITAGQFNGGRVDVADSAIIEFPSADAPFADEDNDGIYFTASTVTLTDTLIGWALDDGVDAGSGSGSNVTVRGCWFESCFHEGMAWSGGGTRAVSETVAINCGQGIENGWANTIVAADRILSTANAVGARFGDNYDWDYEGKLTVRDSLLLYNRRDLWAREWDSWTERTDALIAEGNRLSADHPLYPMNAVWDPASDAERLAPFLPAPDAIVGVGFAVRASEVEPSALGDRVPVRLSTFTRNPVSVGYALQGDGGEIASGSVTFAPGETVRFVELSSPLDPRALRLILRDPVNAEISGVGEILVVRAVQLVASGDAWRYFDRGSEPAGDWRSLDHPDADWKEGPSQLGEGDGDEATRIDIGPSGNRYSAVYFRRRFEVADPAAIRSLEVRLLRDDGAIVWLNGRDVFRSNMPDGPVSYSTWASGTVSGADENRFYAKTIDPSALLAGTNILAVEVHQINGTSSDLSFDLELLARIAPAAPADPLFIRADANADGAHDIGDAVAMLDALFGSREILCARANDANGDGRLDIADPISFLAYLFVGGSAPPAPFPDCGADPTPDPLSCRSYPLCQ